MRDSHLSGVNDRRPLVWSPLGHWSGCVFYATWGKECAGVSYCVCRPASVTEWSYTLSVCVCVSVSKRGQSKQNEPERHTLCRDSGGLNILEVSWSRVICSQLIWKQKRRHAEKMTLNRLWTHTCPHMNTNTFWYSHYTQCLQTPGR